MGDLGNTQKFITGVVIVGVLLIAGIFIASSIQTALEEDVTLTATVSNESGAYINSTGYTLVGASTSGFSSPTLTLVLNATDNSTIGLGNITVSDAGVITNATTTVWSDVLISYTYNYPSVETSAASNASGDLITSLSNGSGWLTILIVVGFAVLVISFLTTGFDKGKDQKFSY